MRLSPVPQKPPERDSESDSDVFRRGSIHSDSSYNTSTREDSDNSDVPRPADLSQEADKMMPAANCLLNGLLLD